MVRDRRYGYLGNIGDIDYDWYKFAKLVATHPHPKTKWTDDKKRVELSYADTRPSLPTFAHDIVNNLGATFPENTPTLVAFAGFTSDHQSISIHRDIMDVFYVQVVGEVRWEIWEPSAAWFKGLEKDVEGEASLFNIQPDQGTKIWEKNLSPGDAVWVPRGVWHQVIPFGPRIGFSFGLEGQPDPSTYI